MFFKYHDNIQDSVSYSANCLFDTGRVIQYLMKLIGRRKIIMRLDEVCGLAWVWYDHWVLSSILPLDVHLL